MRNPLFIDNDILPDDITSSSPDNVIKTAISSDDITTDYDTFFSGIMSKEVRKYKECDCIILPYSLDRDHYSGLLGIVAAMHLRLTPEWGFSRKPIVFIGPDPIEQVAKLSEYGELLFTPWVFYSSLQTYDELNLLLNIIDGIIGTDTEMSDGAYASFLKKMKVVPPAMFGTRHSVANSWCRYHWFKKVGIEDKIPENDLMLSNVLYFKYMKHVGMYRAQQEEERYAIDPINNENAKILLVDDEADKWEPFFKRMIKETDDKHFVSIGEDFNRFLKRKDLINYVDGQVENINPDVVLLDLRLHEDDSRNDLDRKELSGNKILEKIKNKNKGIQVIAFSASNKDRSYRDFPYDYVFIKDSPDNALFKEETKMQIDDLCEKIALFLKRGGFLKSIYKKFDDIKKLIDQSGFFIGKEDEIKSYVDVAFDMIYKEDKEYLAHAYLQLYIILEELLNNIYVHGDGCLGIEYVDDYIINGNHSQTVVRWDKDKEGVWVTQVVEGGCKINHFPHRDRVPEGKIIKKDTNYKAVAVLSLLYNRPDLKGNTWQWSSIRDCRNQKAAHPPKGAVSKSDIDCITDFLTFMLDKKNIHESFFGVVEEGEDGMSNYQIDSIYDKMREMKNQEYTVEKDGKYYHCGDYCVIDSRTCEKYRLLGKKVTICNLNINDDNDSLSRNYLFKAKVVF